MNKEIDVFSVLTKEQAKQVDDVGYRFLQANGYAQANKAQESRQQRSLLIKALKNHGEQLVTKQFKRGSTIIIWFELRKKRGNVLKAKSDGISIQFTGGIADGAKEEDN